MKKLTASDGAAFDYFGFDVSINGDTLVVGALFNEGRGAAYVFYRNWGGADNWGEVKKITPSDEASADFGSSVAASGDTILVGAPYAKNGGLVVQGAAYVFYRDQGGADQWGEVKKLIASDSGENYTFGWSVSADGNTILVGALGADVGGNDAQGAAYVFYRNQGEANNWGEVKKISASGSAASNAFGCSVSLSGDAVVVGASVDYGSQGTAYIFYRNQGGTDQWGEVKQLTASDGVFSTFGHKVSVSGNTIVVGTLSVPGSAYIFYRDLGGANNWGEVKKLTAPDSEVIDRFGFSVSVNGDRLLVGAPGYEFGPPLPGAAYLFARNQGGADNWGEIQKLIGDPDEVYDFFGQRVSMSENIFVVGAPFADIGENEDEGAAYIYVPSTPVIYLPIVVR